MKDFKDRVAVVTGGASGIGRAMAERFAADGMKVVIADVEERSLAETEGALRGRGADVLAVRCDVSKGAEVDALSNRVFEQLGAVHVLCNNAGVAVGGPLWQHTLEDWQWVLGVNLWGVIHGIRAFVPRMLAGGHEGHVVNTASIAGLSSTPFLGIYNVTKHAVVTMSETLHQEFLLAGAKLRVSVLCPGWVKTRIHDSYRNRPDAGAAAAQTTAMPMNDMVGQLVATGIPPESVADQVADAIRDEKLYILTHPELMGAVKLRMSDLLAGRTPAPFDLAAMTPKGK